MKLDHVNRFLAYKKSLLVENAITHVTDKNVDSLQKMKKDHRSKISMVAKK